MASRLMRRDARAARGRLYRASEAAFDSLHGAYGRSLAWVLDHHRLMLAVTIAAVAVTIIELKPLA